MDPDQRATWIRRAVVLSLAIAVALSAWFYPKREKPAAAETPPAEEVAKPKHEIEILHFHEPGNPDSELIAQYLTAVEVKYTGQVLVTRLDVKDHPERAKAEKVTKPPKVVMMAGDKRVCKFQGVWTEAQIELKVEQILRGLKRVDKDWRPEVKGMTPATISKPSPGDSTQQ